MSLKVVITGTSSGLGAELKQRFEEDKHRVIGSTLVSEAVAADQWRLDLTDNKSIDLFAAGVRDELHEVDVLTNNAGYNAIRKFEDLDADFVNEIMAVNFLGPVMLIQKLLPVMSSRAIVINVISDAAWRPMRHSLAYNCSKAALDMATKQMARELTKPYDISILGVRPGKMQGTGMSNYIDSHVCALRNWTIEEARAYAANNSVTGKETPPSVVANLIYNLCLSGSARYMSGACLDLVG